MAGMIETERELRGRFAAVARRRLGPEAGEAEVEAWVDEAYYDGPPRKPPKETEEERAERELRTAEAIQLMDKWNVPRL